MKYALPAVIFLTACTGEANHLGNPLLLPLSGIGNAISNGTYNQRRGQVELYVKTNHPALLVDIDAGGGAHLTEAMNIAEVSAPKRPALILDLQGDRALYAANLEAMIVTLMVYGP